MAEDLVVRADADSRIGTGHVMRCLALAQALRARGGQATFVTATESSALKERLRTEGGDVVSLTAEPGDVKDADRVIDTAYSVGAPWVVVDGYHFGPEYQRVLKDAGLKLLLIDDKGQGGRYFADLILNQNLHADESWYADRPPSSKLLLGSQYVLLRPEFIKWRGDARNFVRGARNILVTLGGSDPNNATLKVIRALQRAGLQAEVLVVIGVTNPHYEELQSAVLGGRPAVRLLRNVSNMPELMAWSELAVTSGGTTVWELAFMGVPAVVGRIAPVEDLLVAGLNKHGLFFDAGWFDQLPDDFPAMLAEIARNQQMLNVMSDRGRRIVDGYGCERVLSAVTEHCVVC